MDVHNTLYGLCILKSICCNDIYNEVLLFKPKVFWTMRLPDLSFMTVLNQARGGYLWNLRGCPSVIEVACLFQGPATVAGKGTGNPCGDKRFYDDDVYRDDRRCSCNE
jgi:hypothetical protein